MNVKILFLGLLLLLFTSQAFADTTPPVTTFSSFQVPNTTDQNITLTCTDNNSGCETINYNINNTEWIKIENFPNNLLSYYRLDETSGTTATDTTGAVNGISTNVTVNQAGKIDKAYLFNNASNGYISLGDNYRFQSGDAFSISAWINTISMGGGNAGRIFDTRDIGGGSNGFAFRLGGTRSICFTTFGFVDICGSNNVIPNNSTWYFVTLTRSSAGAVKLYVNGSEVGSGTASTIGGTGTLAYIGRAPDDTSVNFDGLIDEFGIWDSVLTTDEITALYNSGSGARPSSTDLNNYSFLYSGAGSHSIQYFSTDNSDNNETIKTSTFTTYGVGHFHFIDENTYAPVTTTYTINPSINGITTGNATSLDLNLQGITNQPYSFSFTSTGYGTRFYYTDLNQFSALDFNQLMLQDTNAANNITLNIYNATGTTLQTGTPVTITKANYLVGRYLTNSDGAITPFLKDLDTNYLFNVEGAYTTSQRPVLVYRPKYDSNFTDITGNWQITLTGPNSTNRYTITTNSQVVAILPNTETLYSAKVCMLTGSVCSTTYFSRTYLLGFKGLFGETSIQPYLNLISDSTLRTLKVLDYATNQPYPLAKIVITSKTDLGVTYTIESLYTDSTGTAGVYLTDGQTYTLTANDLTSYTIIPNAATLTYYIYFNFLILPTNDSNAIDVNTSNDINMAEFFVMRNTLFSCSGTSDCFPSALLAIILTMIILVVATAVTVGNFIGVKGLSLIAFICFTIFFGIGWLPIYIFAFLGSITILMLVVVQ